MYHPGTAAAGVGAGAVTALAFTGAYALMLVAVGVTLLFGGLLLVAASRRGRSRKSASV